VKRLRIAQVQEHEWMKQDHKATRIDEDKMALVNVEMVKSVAEEDAYSSDESQFPYSEDSDLDASCSDGSSMDGSMSMSEEDDITLEASECSMELDDCSSGVVDQVPNLSRRMDKVPTVCGCQHDFDDCEALVDGGVNVTSVSVCGHLRRSNNVTKGGPTRSISPTPVRSRIQHTIMRRRRLSSPRLAPKTTSIISNNPRVCASRKTAAAELWLAGSARLPGQPEALVQV